MPESAEEPSLFAKYSNLMDKKIKGVQIGCYSIAFIGLAYAIRKVRPFSRFKRPFDIPKRFVKERRALNGIVERIEPNGGLLMINHEPLITLPGMKPGELPSKLTGVELTGHAVGWLQTLVAGNRVTFIPIKREQNYVECEIRLDQILPKNEVRIIDVGESLVKVGFAKVIERSLSKKDPDYAYYMRLKNAEHIALKREMGLRYYVKPTKLILMMIGAQLNKFAQSLVRTSIQRASKVPKVAAA